LLVYGLCIPLALVLGYFLAKREEGFTTLTAQEIYSL
jgi:hypothetical protein